MTNVVLIGDVHGKYRPYRRILRQADLSSLPTIALGDMGVGFRKEVPWESEEPKFYPNPPHYAMKKGPHRFIRGNHDNLSVCKEQELWIPDGTVETIGHSTVMFVGGAVSIDRDYRREGYTWWPDEELSDEELDAIYKVYKETKPDVMLTHEAPESIALAMNHRTFKFEFESRTRVWFDRMFSIHKPEAWFFGHWHKSWSYKHEGTIFYCLDELETKEVEF